LDELINVEGLSTHYSTFEGLVRAVDDVSLKIKKGEAVALVGESGSGKSTAAFSIMKLVPKPGNITGGKILLEGKDIMNFSDSEMVGIRGREMGMIFQEPMTFLNPLKKVGEQIAESIRIHENASYIDAIKKAENTLRLVQLPNPEVIINYYPHQLSGGMRQRVLIAIAISCRPKILIADEPTTALDVTIQAQIMELLSRLCKESNTALLLITHDLGLVAQYCDRIYVMYAGQIVEEGNTFDLFDSPQHPYTEALLNCALMFDRRTENFKTISGKLPSRINPPKGCRFHPRCKKVMKNCNLTIPSLFEIKSGSNSRCLLHK